MKSLLSIGLITTLLIGDPLAAATTEKELTPGQQLAQDMRHTQLLNYERIAGKLRTKGRRGKRTEHTIELRTGVLGGKWHSVFRAVHTGTGAVTELTILRSPETSPEYTLALGARDSAPLEAPVAVPNEASMTPFAGTDFWLSDLGLSFFYWPQQEILTNARIKMRKGVACYVLESRDPNQAGNGYNRVRSWVSREHGGLVYAEAYNAEGREVKTFEVADVEKVDGHWKLSRLRIRDAVAKSTTDLIFDNSP